MSEAAEHEPVMVEEVVDLFRPVPPGLVVDATVGSGGHARALLDALDHVRLLGLDRDTEALAAAAGALAGYGERAVLRAARFDELTSILREERGVTDVSGVLFDLGVSSPQLDRADRGFSYRADGPLDMRMSQSDSTTAADVVNSYDEHRLAQVIGAYGDERYSRRIARAIVAARPIDRTGQLADVVRDAIPAPARRRGGHPARRTFQALRIEVNRELDVLGPALDQAIDVLVPGGRCVVLAYHSGEDRIVKERFRTAETGGCTCPPGLPCVCGARPVVRLLNRGARKPTSVEVARNRRAESARLRAVEKLAPPDPDDGDAA
jgi:16S rRNA (cytosine1402-N4)-methyltransferase